MARDKRSRNENNAALRFGWEQHVPSWLACLVICAVGVIVYSNTLHSSFHFDDETSIIDNLALRNLGDLSSVFRYSPTRFVTYLSFALNYSLGGLDVTGYHLVNLFLHIAASLMVRLLTREILRAPFFKETDLPRKASLVSLIAALVFVAHPLQTQAVTYLAQRAAVLAALAYVSAMYFYSRARSQQQLGASGLSVYGGFALAAVCGLVGLFSKETALTLPLTIVLYEWFFLRRGRSRSWWVAALLLFAFLAVPLVLSFGGLLELNVQGAPDRSVYLLTQTRVVMTYLRLLVLPVGQNLDYDFQLSRSMLDVTTILSALSLAVIVFVAYKLFPRYRLFSFAVAWFFLTLVPESSILPLPDVIYEHRLYLPMAGFALIAAAIIYEITKRAKLREIVLLSVCVLGALGWSTYERNKIWQDEISLWSDVISKSPNKPRGYSNRGKAYIEQKLYNSALIDLNRAIALDPSYGEAYNNRGNALLALGEFDKAIADYEAAQRVGISYRPVANKLLYNLGTAYFDKGLVAKSIEYFTQAIKENSADPAYYYNRAVAYGKFGELAKAIADYDQAIRLNPGYVKAFNNRGAMHEQGGHLDEALADYAQASKLDQTFTLALLNKGRILGLKGDDVEAVAVLTVAIARESNRPDLYLMRGRSYLKIRENEKSLADFQKAISLNPLSGEAYYNRGLALEALIRAEESQQSYRTAAGLGYKKGTK